MIRSEPAPGGSPFDWLSRRLMETTGLGDKISDGDPRRREMAVRGTVRLALKRAGLPPESVASGELQAVIQRILPGLLSARGVKEAEAICGSLATELEAQRFVPSHRDDRLGGFMRRTT